MNLQVRARGHPQGRPPDTGDAEDFIYELFAGFPTAARNDKAVVLAAVFAQVAFIGVGFGGCNAKAD